MVKIKALTSCAGNFQKDGTLGNLTSLSVHKIYEVDEKTFNVDALIEKGIVEKVVEEKPVKKKVEKVKDIEEPAELVEKPKKSRMKVSGK